MIYFFDKRTIVLWNKVNKFAHQFMNAPNQSNNKWCNMLHLQVLCLLKLLSVLELQGTPRTTSCTPKDVLTFYIIDLSHMPCNNYEINFSTNYGIKWHHMPHNKFIYWLQKFCTVLVDHISSHVSYPNP